MPSVRLPALVLIVPILGSISNIEVNRNEDFEIVDNLMNATNSDEDYFLSGSDWHV